MRGHSKKVAVYKANKGALPVSRTVINKFPLFKLPGLWYFIMAAKDEEYSHKMSQGSGLPFLWNLKGEEKQLLEMLKP